MDGIAPVTDANARTPTRPTTTPIQNADRVDSATRPFPCVFVRMTPPCPRNPPFSRSPREARSVPERVRRSRIAPHATVCSRDSAAFPGVWVRRGWGRDLAYLLRPRDKRGSDPAHRRSIGVPRDASLRSGRAGEPRPASPGVGRRPRRPTPRSRRARCRGRDPARRPGRLPPPCSRASLRAPRSTAPGAPSPDRRRAASPGIAS